MWFILRVLRLSLGAIFLTPITALANDRFTFESVAAIAKKSAAAPYRAPQPVPDFLTAISYDDYRDIRFDTQKSLWRDGGSFQVQFIHRCWRRCMWLHSKFVLLTLLGRPINGTRNSALGKTDKWNAQQRTASGTT